ncbi:MAG: hypothetical protein K6E28_05780, partial [Eubacterium sp.]|nr:hypothetical protein [Eubacterium sp.]
MRKKEKGQREEKENYSKEKLDFFERDKEEKKRNRLKNRPIILMTYITAALFLSLFIYIIYYVYHDADKIIANSS